MRVAIVGYRAWAYNLYCKVQEKQSKRETLWLQWYDDFAALDNTVGIDVYFFVGWSEIIPEEWYKDKLVIILHPSPLPLYRGGSPLQHQIINGETQSAVTLFKLDAAYPDVDAGPIISQRPYALHGNLSEVLNRIVDVGSTLVYRAIEDLYDKCLAWTPQDESRATTFKRRKPTDSEIGINELGVLEWDPTYGLGLAIHNKVRALQDPYPNAYVQFPDGRLYITQTQWMPNA